VDKSGQVIARASGRARSKNTSPTISFVNVVKSSIEVMYENIAVNFFDATAGSSRIKWPHVNNSIKSDKRSKALMAELGFVDENVFLANKKSYTHYINNVFGRFVEKNELTDLLAKNPPADFKYIVYSLITKAEIPQALNTWDFVPMRSVKTDKGIVVSKTAGEYSYDWALPRHGIEPGESGHIYYYLIKLYKPYIPGDKNDNLVFMVKNRNQDGKVIFEFSKKR